MVERPGTKSLVAEPCGWGVFLIIYVEEKCQDSFTAVAAACLSLEGEE